MYIPKFYRVPVATQHELIENHPFATMVTSVSGELQGVHVPFVLHRDEGPYGTLLAHMARANPIASVLPDGPEVLIAFTGPQAYISATDYASGEPFPTWSFVVAHASGRARQLSDDELRTQLRELIATQEARLPREPWTLERASQEAFEGFFRQIVGFEVPIRKLEGYFKLHQRNALQDADSQAHALRQRGNDTAAALADLIDAHNRHRRE